MVKLYRLWWKLDTSFRGMMWCYDGQVVIADPSNKIGIAYLSIYVFIYGRVLDLQTAVCTLCGHRWVPKTGDIRLYLPF